MARNFRSYLENEYTDEDRDKLFEIVRNYYDTSDENVELLKDYLWKCLYKRLEKIGIRRNTLKIMINRTSGWFSERDDEIYKLEFLKPDNDICELDIYEKMKISIGDAFIEEYGW